MDRSLPKAASHFVLQRPRPIAASYSHHLTTMKLRDIAFEAVEADLLPWCTSDLSRNRCHARPLTGRQQDRCVVCWRQVVRVALFPKVRLSVSFTGLVSGRTRPDSSCAGARSRLVVSSPLSPKRE